MAGTKYLVENSMYRLPFLLGAVVVGQFARGGGTFKLHVAPPPRRMFAVPGCSMKK